MTKNAVVIVAAGRGSRIKDDNGPKQYRMLGDKCVLQLTIDAFAKHSDIQTIQCVIHADDYEIYSKLIAPNNKLLTPVTGGATRQESCKAGIDALLETEKVLVHDAARPFVSISTITNVLSGIGKTQCSLPASAIADTIKRVDDKENVVETVPRHDLYLAQTPQGFVYQEIKQAHQDAAVNSNTEFTDDAAVAEWAGINVKLVEGNRENFKITTLEDLKAAEDLILAFSKSQIPDVRTGNGYDVHTLGDGDGVILCGFKIAHDKSLQGHSDADVGLHALTDALLGTIGAGDIGSHFPPSDPKWKGASSDRFLEHAVKLVTVAGGTIMNMDVTIICEAPKIGPHRDEMRQSMSKICNVDLKRISVKATTNEKIGFIGREEGISAIATASVVFL